MGSLELRYFSNMADKHLPRNMGLCGVSWEVNGAGDGGGAEMITCREIKTSFNFLPF